MKPGGRPVVGDGPEGGEETGPVGPFPSWAWVYGTVLSYGALTILLLWILTRVLDPGTGP